MIIGLGSFVMTCGVQDGAELILPGAVSVGGVEGEPVRNGSYRGVICPVGPGVAGVCAFVSIEE